MMTDLTFQVGVLAILLPVVGFFLIKLQSVIEKNTDAVGSLQIAVEKLSALLDAQGLRIEKLEDETTIIRNRYHDLVNRYQASALKLELLMDRERKGH